jgi:hypothetical protein
MKSCVPLLVVVWLSGVLGAPDCIFTVPSVDDSSSCVLYNLTSVASNGPFKLTMGDYEYIFGICGQVNSSLVSHCSIPAAVAYQYNASSSSCYALGNSEKDSTYTVSQSMQPLFNKPCYKLMTFG